MARGVTDNERTNKSGEPMGSRLGLGNAWVSKPDGPPACSVCGERPCQRTGKYTTGRGETKVYFRDVCGECRWRMDDTYKIQVATSRLRREQEQRRLAASKTP